MVTSEALGPLEMQVLGLLDANEGRAVADVRDRLEKAGETLAYTTVMTVLVRLSAKGMVRRVKDGNRYLYRPAKGAAQMSHGIFRHIKAKLFGSEHARPILALLDDEKVSIDELRKLRRAIDEKIRERKKP